MDKLPFWIKAVANTIGALVLLTVFVAFVYAFALMFGGVFKRMICMVTGSCLLYFSTTIKPVDSEGREYLEERKGPGMMQLEKWDERQITLDIDRYRGNWNVLSKYLDSVVERFVIGQDTQTMQVRTRFLEEFNKYAEVARVTYGWKRYLQGGRAALEEDLADVRAAINLKRGYEELAGPRYDPDLGELQNRVNRLELLIEIARREKTIEGIRRAKSRRPPKCERVRSRHWRFGRSRFEQRLRIRRQIEGLTRICSSGS